MTVWQTRVPHGDERDEDVSLDLSKRSLQPSRLQRVETAGVLQRRPQTSRLQANH